MSEAISFGVVESLTVNRSLFPSIGRVARSGVVRYISVCVSSFLARLRTICDNKYCPLLILDRHFYFQPMVFASFFFYDTNYGRRKKAIVFYRWNFYFVSIAERPAWNLNQTWPVDQKWCRFTNDRQTFRPAKNIKNFDHFFRDFRTRHRISSEWNVASTNRKLMLIYNVSPKI